MTKALFKKQMLEVFAWLYKDTKTGNHRTKKGIIRYAIIYLLLFGFIGVIFYFTADMLCEALVMAKMGWLYWCLMGLVALFLGVFGSVFNTFTSLYQAKDNDLLLSMPIPAPIILLTRLSGVYAMGLMYELIVMIPTLIVWFQNASFNVTAFIFEMVIPFILSVIVLVLSAVLGWVVALISSRLKHKNILTVLLSLIFIGVYYFLSSQASLALQAIIQNPVKTGDKVRNILYPLYHMGLAAEGNALSMLIFTAIALLLFGIVYLVMSHSFLKLATSNKGEVKKLYKEQQSKKRSVSNALFRKELCRFKGSPNYMLNCGLGIVLMPVAAVALIWKADTVSTFLSLPFIQEYIPLIAAAGIGILSAMNDISAPSVSLEGKNLWLVQVLPVSAGQVLTAKLNLHLLLTLIPALPLIAAVEWLIKPKLIFAILIPVFAILFILFTAVLGLAINLKTPNLTWTNETVPIKQSIGVTATMFGGWIIITALAGIYIKFESVFTPKTYLILCCVLLAVLSTALLRWLMTKGSRIFAAL